MGKDVFETIRYFGEVGKLFKVHFRNVDKPLPYFVETFIDDGYMDMYQVMQALHEVDFTWEGFQWIDFHDTQQSVVSFLRRGKTAGDELVCVFNCTPTPRVGYRIGAPGPAPLEVVLNTDARNERSRAAIERIGATFEGVLHSFRYGVEGTPRDTATFAVTAIEDHPSTAAKARLLVSHMRRALDNNAANAGFVRGSASTPPTSYSARYPSACHPTHRAGSTVAWC